MTNLQETSEEVWKDVPGYEGIYQASTLGNVRVLDRIRYGGRNPNKPSFFKGKMLKQYKLNNGYMNITLGRYRVCNSVLVHRVVAETFIEKIEGKDFINHKNLNRSDNRVENLEWCTHLENMQYSARIRREKRKQAA